MAGRPRKSALELLIAGTWRRDRHGGRSLPPTDPLGNPPAHLGPAVKKIWREVAASAPWLRLPDRGPLEVYVCLMAEARSGFAAMPASRLALLTRQAARLGLGPVDRTRITLQPERSPNPFDEFSDPGEKFFNRNTTK
jgi:hypothetical protein